MCRTSLCSYSLYGWMLNAFLFIKKRKRRATFTQLNIHKLYPNMLSCHVTYLDKWLEWHWKPAKWVIVHSARSVNMSVADTSIEYLEFELNSIWSIYELIFEHISEHGFTSRTFSVMHWAEHTPISTSTIVFF